MSAMEQIRRFASQSLIAVADEKFYKRFFDLLGDYLNK